MCEINFGERKLIKVNNEQKLAKVIVDYKHGQKSILLKYVQIWIFVQNGQNSTKINLVKTPDKNELRSKTKTEFDICQIFVKFYFNLQFNFG